MDKATRVLILFYDLMQGKSVNKHVFIEKYELNERSFERDIKTLRNFLMEMHIASEIVFDRRENTYYLLSWEKNKFTSIEVITGSMKNCLQFMYAGKLLTVKIRCKNLFFRR